MTMRVNGGASSAYAAAQTAAAGAARQDAVKSERMETPAYAVEISARGRDESDGEYIARLMRSTKRYDGEIKVGSMEEFYTSWRAKQKELTERAAEKNRGVFEDLRETNPYIMETYDKGDDLASIDISFELRLQGSILHNPLFSEANERFEKYRNVARKIRAGGEETFRWYNLKFAGMAAYANTFYMDGELQKRIARGHTTVEEYTRAKSYASELQNRAGVFVAPDFSVPSENYAEGIRYTYNGSLANIGVKLLDFMARHREAGDVWVKAAQGAYKNHSEILTALKDAGLDDTAAAYHEFVNAATNKNYTMDKAMKRTFSHEVGGFWDAVISDDDVYGQLQRSMRGGDTSPMRYIRSEMNRALADSADELKFLSTVHRQRKPARIVQQPDGRWVRIEETEESDKNVRRPDNPLDQELANLRKQLAEVKKSAMSDDQKQPLITSIQNRIMTIQAQLLSELQGENKKNKYAD